MIGGLGRITQSPVFCFLSGISLFYRALGFTRLKLGVAHFGPRGDLDGVPPLLACNFFHLPGKRIIVVNVFRYIGNCPPFTV